LPEIRNPQEEPGNERRLLLVFALTFIVLMALQPLIMKYFVKQQAPAPQTAQQQQVTPPQIPATSTQPAQGPAAPATPASAKQAKAEGQIVVENDLYRITFTNKGAQVKSWVLKKYNDDKGHPLELVNQLGAEKVGYPMSLYTYDPALRDKINSALYLSSAEGKLTTPATLAFEYSDGGTSVTKTYHFDESYVVKVDTSVTQNGQTVQAFPSWPAGFGDQTVPISYASSQVVFEKPNEKIQRKDAKKVSGDATLGGPFYFAGVSDQYFASVFLPDKPEQAAVVTLHNEVAIPKNLDKPDPKDTIPVPVLGAAVGNMNGPTTERVFVGPKNVSIIEGVHATPLPGQATAPDLGGLVDFGFFSFFARPLFLWLKWTQQHMIPNWGWAIVFLTVVINAALLPLRISSMKSMLKMQKVQPLINDVKKKYEKYSMRDPRRQEMNQEVAALFKEHGVNPTGGCLPMIIQLPFLWAFYQMLANTIELRHAPWLWIHDLAAPDPTHILPISIVISTWAMQKMTPSAGMDPNQQRMMNLMMPVMLGFFSWNVASGLAVYWLIGTVIAIIMQQGLNRTHLGREMRAMMEKRARKQQQKAKV
jgi:YidC/Oxa1 family membrane protein insertase